MKINHRIVIVLLSGVNVISSLIIIMLVYVNNDSQGIVEANNMDSSQCFYLLTSINDKINDLDRGLKLQNEYNLNSQNGTNQSIEEECSLIVEDHKDDYQNLENLKYNLINELNNYDVNIPLFLSDNRLKKLPEKDRKEIMDEVARRIDNGEINKRLFFPGYSN